MKTPSKLNKFFACDEFALTMRPAKPGETIPVETCMGYGELGSGALWEMVPHKIKAVLELRYPDGFTVSLAIRKQDPDSRHYTVSERLTGLGALCYFPYGLTFPTNVENAWAYFLHQLRFGGSMNADGLRKIVEEKQRRIEEVNNLLTEFLPTQPA